MPTWFPYQTNHCFHKDRFFVLVECNWEIAVFLHRIGGIQCFVRSRKNNIHIFLTLPVTHHTVFSQKNMLKNRKTYNFCYLNATWCGVCGGGVTFTFYELDIFSELMRTSEFTGVLWEEGTISLNFTQDPKNCHINILYFCI